MFWQGSEALHYPRKDSWEGGVEKWFESNEDHHLSSVQFLTRDVPGDFMVIYAITE